MWEKWAILFSPLKMNTSFTISRDKGRERKSAVIFLESGETFIFPTSIFFISCWFQYLTKGDEVGLNICKTGNYHASLMSSTIFTALRFHSRQNLCKTCMNLKLIWWNRQKSIIFLPQILFVNYHYLINTSLLYILFLSVLLGASYNQAFNLEKHLLPLNFLSMRIFKTNFSVQYYKSKGIGNS